jgi:hypothetical protein
MSRVAPPFSQPRSIAGVELLEQWLRAFLVHWRPHYAAGASWRRT